MKIAIIGAGFTGLSAGYYLSKAGSSVVIFEKNAKPGGLAIGFSKSNWKWNIEEHYHHLFAGDKNIQNLAKEVGVKILFQKPKTSMLYKDCVYQIDNPISLMMFPHLTFFERFRTGLLILYLKYNRNWKKLENITSEKFLIKSIGNKSWEILFKPLFISKFGKLYSQIPASWFWARIKKRSTRLGYPEKGFQFLADKLAKNIIKNGGTIKYKTALKSIKKINNRFDLTLSDSKIETFDKVIFTLSSDMLAILFNDLEKEYKTKLTSSKSLGVVTLLLSLKNKFFNDNTYWLNINDIQHPYTAVVEHTNFINKDNYNNENLLYVSKYLPTNHKYFTYSEKGLLNEFMPYLQMINPLFSFAEVREKFLFKSAFAQPVVSLNQSKNILPLQTPIEGLYLANMQSIYPWDRGTNFAIQLGEAVAEMING